MSSILSYLSSIVSFEIILSEPIEFKKMGLYFKDFKNLLFLQIDFSVNNNYRSTYFIPNNLSIAHKVLLSKYYGSNSKINIELIRLLIDILGNDYILNI